MIRVLGLDPGIAITGYGLITEHRRNLQRAGVIATSKESSDQVRLHDLYIDAKKLYSELCPTHVCIERLFFGVNSKTALRVAQARGVLLAAMPPGIPLYEYTPNQVKLGVTGTGKADKKLMQLSIQKYFNLDNIIQPDDANDAVGICLHGWLTESF